MTSLAPSVHARQTQARSADAQVSSAVNRYHNQPHSPTARRSLKPSDRLNGAQGIAFFADGESIGLIRIVGSSVAALRPRWREPVDLAGRGGKRAPAGKRVESQLTPRCKLLRGRFHVSLRALAGLASCLPPRCASAPSPCGQISSCHSGSMPYVDDAERALDRRARARSPNGRIRPSEVPALVVAGWVPRRSEGCKHPVLGARSSRGM